MPHKGVRRGRRILKPAKSAAEESNNHPRKCSGNGTGLKPIITSVDNASGGAEGLWRNLSPTPRRNKSKPRQNPGGSPTSFLEERREPSPFSTLENQLPFQEPVQTLTDAVGSRRMVYKQGAVDCAENEFYTPLEFYPRFSIASVDVPLNPNLDSHWLPKKEGEIMNWRQESGDSSNSNNSYEWLLLDPTTNSVSNEGNWHLYTDLEPTPKTEYLEPFGMRVSDSLRSQYEHNLMLARELNHGIVHYQQEGQEPEPHHQFIEAQPSEENDLAPEASPDMFSVRPGIYVFPMRSVNFTNTHVQFTIQVINVPPMVRIIPSMFEAVVESPSGATITCHIRKDPAKTEATQLAQLSANMMKPFQGSFSSSREVGLYSLKVRLVMPFALSENNTLGVLGDTCTILVSRNYYRDSQRSPGIFYPLDFMEQQRMMEVPLAGSFSVNQTVWGLACDGLTNRLYYSERMNNRITCMDPSNGRVLFRFNHILPCGLLNRPTGIACDEYHRRLIVADKDNHRITCFTMDGEYIGYFGERGHQNGCFNYPWDVAVSPLGTCIAVADSRNKRVQLFDMYGNFINKFSIFERDPFSYKHYFDYPRGITFNAEGQLIYVTDFKTQNVLEISIDMSNSRRLAPEGSLLRPQGIIVDQIGGLLVADSRNNCVRNLSWDGQLLGSVRSSAGRSLTYPVNLALMPGGRIAILDGGGRVHVV